MAVISGHLQSFRGEDCWDRIPWTNREDNPRHTRRRSFHVHLRWGIEAERTQQKNNVHSSHSAVERSFYVLQQVWLNLEWKCQSLAQRKYAIECSKPSGVVLVCMICNPLFYLFLFSNWIDFPWFGCTEGFPACEFRVEQWNVIPTLPPLLIITTTSKYTVRLEVLVGMNDYKLLLELNNHYYYRSNIISFHPCLWIAIVSMFHWF